MRMFAAAALVSVCFIACGSDGGGGQQVDPAAACIQLTKAQAMGAVRCAGSTSQADYDHAYGLLMMINSCDLVKSLRDPKSFINECLPAIAAIDCANSGKAIPSCQFQLQY